MHRTPCVCRCSIFPLEMTYNLQEIFLAVCSLRKAQGLLGGARRLGDFRV